MKLVAKLFIFMMMVILFSVRSEVKFNNQVKNSIQSCYINNLPARMLLTHGTAKTAILISGQPREQQPKGICVGIFRCTWQLEEQSVSVSTALGNWQCDEEGYRPYGDAQDIVNLCKSDSNVDHFISQFPQLIEVTFGSNDALCGKLERSDFHARLAQNGKILLLSVKMQEGCLSLVASRDKKNAIVYHAHSDCNNTTMPKALQVLSTSSQSDSWLIALSNNILIAQGMHQTGGDLLPTGDRIVEGVTKQDYVKTWMKEVGNISKTATLNEDEFDPLSKLNTSTPSQKLIHWFAAAVERIDSSNQTTERSIQLRNWLAMQALNQGSAKPKLHFQAELSR